jgi:hypothetical protein
MSNATMDYPHSHPMTVYTLPIAEGAKVNLELQGAKVNYYGHPWWL